MEETSPPFFILLPQAGNNLELINKLNIDHTTYRELELLSSGERRLSVFERINKTETSGGKDKLQRYFLDPEYDVGSIKKKHEAINFILRNPDNWELPVNKKLMDLVEYYYFLKIDPVLSSFKVINLFEGMRYWLMHRSYYKTFKEGINNLFILFRRLDRFYKLNESNELPELLKHIFNNFGQILNEKFIREIVAGDDHEGPDFLDIFTVDKAFREDYKEKMAVLIDLIYELDVLVAMAKAHREFNLVFPEFIESDNAQIEIKGLRHLFVKNCTPNDFLMGDGKFFMFLTGPNMAGKTTYLKACGIAVFLAHLGFGVPADEMKLTPFNCIYSSLNTSDDLSKGYSYFYSEVLRVKDAATKLKEHRHNLIIFDELFRGTNIKDAFDGSLLVINGLLKWPGSVFLLSSHLLELAHEFAKEEKIKYIYFDSEVKENKPHFSFKLKEGISDERLGLLILKNEKIDELLNPQSP